jgi:hypothetical protein
VSGHNESAKMAAPFYPGTYILRPSVLIFHAESPITPVIVDSRSFDISEISNGCPASLEDLPPDARAEPSK